MKKGLSFEEKRTKLLEIFHESKDFYQLKELEKIAPKQKGIVSQSVKEVLDSLVADYLVVGEKIGTSNYFWSFPSAAIVSSRQKLDNLKVEEEQLTEQKATLEIKLKEALDEREESEERTELLLQIEELEVELKRQTEEIKKYADNDPEVIEAKKKSIDTIKNEANLWTENIFMIQAYCRDRFGMSAADFNSQFGLPDEFDTIP